jgi:phage terminase large subunit
MNDNFTVKLSELIAPVYYDFYMDMNTVHYVLTGGRSSAKGDACYSKYVKELASSPGRLNVFVPIQSTIVDGVMEQVGKVLDRCKIPYVIKTHTSRIELRNGSLIVFKGLAMDNTKKKAEAFKGGDSRLPTIAVVFDELASLDDRDRMDTIVETFSRSAKQFVYIWNPPANKIHWLFDFVEEVKGYDNGKTLHTTVYDLPDEWDAVKSSKANAANKKRADYVMWKHSYLGIAAGVSDMAFPISRDEFVYDVTNLGLPEVHEFYIYVDNGVRDATVFVLIGFNRFTGISYALDTFYHSGRDTGTQFPYSHYAAELRDFMINTGVEKYNKIVSDDLNFALECRKIGIDATHMTDKKRGLMYNTTRDQVMDGKLLILDTPNNEILIRQMLNAQVEEINELGKKTLAVARPNNNSTHYAKQIHAVDCLLYYCLDNGKMFYKRI